MVFLVQQTMIKFIMFTKFTNLLSQHQLKVQILDGSKEKQRKFLETVLALSAGVIQAVATPVQLQQKMAEGERTERTLVYTHGALLECPNGPGLQHQSPLKSLNT